MTLERLTTEARNPASAEIDALSSLEIVRLMNGEDALIAAAVERILPAIARAIDQIAESLRNGGRLIYLGAGTSGRLGVLDASECPPTFNSPPWQVVGLIAGGLTALTRAIEGAEDRPELAIEDLRRLELSKNDVLVGIASSGRTPYVLSGLKFMNELGGPTIGLSCNDASEMAAVAGTMLTPVVGPEVISGSTRLKAGTATKMVLNMLTTGAMVKLGKTYGNLMVDLQATNAKLADRSRRIVSAVTGLEREPADEALLQGHGDVRTAIVMHCCGLGEPQARARLAAAGGQLRIALANNSDEAGKGTSSDNGFVPFIIGVDGGGSKTRAWLCPRDSKGQSIEPIGMGEAGPSNVFAVGWASAVAHIELAIARAFQHAGLERRPVESLCLALAGAGRIEEQQRLKVWASQRLLAEAITVVPDADAVLAAGTPNGEGVALIAGTGSLAWGRYAGGFARAGGLGYSLGDEGSGYWIAREALQACARMLDGREPSTSLCEPLLQAFGARDSAEFLQQYYRRVEDRTAIAGLAGLVFEAAEAKDGVAESILSHAATELAMMVRSVIRKLSAPGEELAMGLPLALAGGTLVPSSLLRERVLENLAATGFTPSSVELVDQPVRGAVRLARRALTGRA
jgi:N-acetylmuramic acid 6-phosphate etherase